MNQFWVFYSYFVHHFRLPVGIAIDSRDFVSVLWTKSPWTYIFTLNKFIENIYLGSIFITRENETKR